LASALAGSVARFPMHPIDTIKAKLQVQQGLIGQGTTRFRIMLKETWKAERFRGLYPGFGIVLCGSAPASCLYFTTYETAKGFILDRQLLYPDLAYMASGMLAELVSCVLWVPIDVVKERLQVQSNVKKLGIFQYKGNISALTTILQTEGLRGIYKGYGATVMSFGPFSGFAFAFNEQCKKFFATLLGRKQKEEGLPYSCFITSGAISGGCASFLTNPLDIAKLRMQVQRGSKAGGVNAYSFNYRNIFHGVWRVAREEGLAGLFRGAGTRMLFHAPSTAITIGSFDSLRQFFINRQRKKNL